jgi:DnaJ family protein B protein 12
VRANRGAGQANAVPDTPRSTLITLLPLIILFAFSLLSALPNLFAEPTTPDPRFAFAPDRRYNTERHTSGLKIRYHVNKAEFSQHPQIAAELAAQASGSRSSSGVLRRFEGNVERIYTQEMYNQCQRGLERRERRKNAEIGLLGIGTDWDRVKQIEEEKVESCEELKRLGVLK